MENVKVQKEGKYQSIRLFKNPILESLSHVHPIIPLLIWAPFSIYMFYRGSYLQSLSLGTTIIIFVFGILFWTLTEYLVHRYLFHFPAKSKFAKRFVFLFHGLHHDDPQDPTRLVMPPIPGILMMTVVYYLYSLIVPAVYLDTFIASFTVGYLIYDYIHFATHHFPMTSKIGKFLRKYHLRHHFSHDDSKYGVSSPLWDYILRTVDEKKVKN